jgi:glycosyltransferase involved in cell wall biosynthesis
MSLCVRMNGCLTTLPRISIVVPSFNQGRYLRQALDSILTQSYPERQIVVMDGGSTDQSLEIIKGYARCLTYWQSQRDGGQAAAINEGLRHCSGDIVAWLNSDDYYLPDALWRIARAYAEFPARGLYVGNGLRDRGSDQQFTPFCRRHVAINRHALTEGLDYVLQPATFFLRTAWEAVGGLDEGLRYCLDWDIIVRIAQRYAAVTINEFLAVTREYAETKTSLGSMERIFEIHRTVRKWTGREVTPGTLHYLIETLLDPRTKSVPPEIQHHLAGAQLAVLEHFRTMCGNVDGFPETADRRDSVYLPLATQELERRPTPDLPSLPSISVVVPSLNQATFLGQALDSILNQGYPNLEIRVYDGGSSDGSVEILRHYGPRLDYWVSERDRGPAHAINKGLAGAKGEILGWLNSDDMLTEDALRVVGRAFAEDPELDLVYANALYIDEENRLHLADHGGFRTGLYYGEMQSPERIPAYWSYVHAVPQPTVFFRRRLLESCGVLDERYHFIFDFELFYRFAAGAKTRKLERTQAFYRIHRGAKTSDWSKFLVELYDFSRARWPGRRASSFYPFLRDFLRGFARRHFDGRPRHLREWMILAVAWLSAAAKVGNPEALMAGWQRIRRDATEQDEVPADASTSRAPDPEPAPGSTYRYTVEGRAPRFRSFFCSLVMPRHPGYFGGEIRDFHLLRYLLKISTVEFFSLGPLPGKGTDDRTDWLTPFLEHCHAPVAGPWEAPRLISRVLDAARTRQLPVVGPRYHADPTNHLRLVGTFGELLRQELDRQEPHFLFVSPQVNPIALTFDTRGLRSRLVMASYDVEAERIRSFAEASRSTAKLAFRLEGRRARRFEEENLQHYDGVIAVSAKDGDVFIGRYGFSRERVLVIENGVDPRYFSFAERSSDPTPRVVFVGTLSYLPNRQAAWRLIRGIMPLVRRQCPDVCLSIVGQVPGATLLAQHDGDRTVVTGRVKDVRPYLARATVACMPLSAGSGTKYKVLEALSAGVPTVCTPTALEGLDLKDGEELLVRETDEELAAAVVTLIKQPEVAARLARQGREVVERQYSWGANLPRLDAWLDLLLSLPRRREVNQ